MSKYVIPQGMMDAAMDDLMARWEKSSDGYRRSILGQTVARTYSEEVVIILKAVIGWLAEEILHEGNVDFHRAILAAERERFPDDVFMQVAFEYGVSFARHYIRELFLARGPFDALLDSACASAPEGADRIDILSSTGALLASREIKSAPVADLLWSETLYANDGEFFKAIPEINRRIQEAYRRGRERQCEDDAHS